MSTTNHIPAAAGWPNLTEAADFIGVSVSTLSRDPQIERVSAGRRDQRVPPREVLRLADLHQKKSLNEVAHELIDYAEAKDARYAAAVEEEVDLFFSERVTSEEPAAGKAEAFLNELKGLVPAEVYRRARVILRSAEDYTPGDVVSPERLYRDSSGES